MFSTYPGATADRRPPARYVEAVNVAVAADDLPCADQPAAAYPSEAIALITEREGLTKLLPVAPLGTGRLPPASAPAAETEKDSITFHLPSFSEAPSSGRAEDGMLASDRGG